MRALQVFLVFTVCGTLGVVVHGAARWLLDRLFPTYPPSPDPLSPVPPADRYPFIDIANGKPVVLVVGHPVEGGGDGYGAGYVGVEHERCTALAAVAPDLDAFFCNRCGHNGSINGVWVTALAGLDDQETNPL